MHSLGNKEESQKHVQIFERLTSEDQQKARERLQEAVQKTERFGDSIATTD